MGASQSAELQLAVMVNILTARTVPPTDRAFWDRLLALGSSPSDVFDSFSFDLLRAIRDRQPHNFASLLKLSVLTLHSVVWRHQQTKAMVTAASLHSSASTQLDPVTSATVAFVTERTPVLLNCLRILSRMLAVLAEAPNHPMHTFVTGGPLHGQMGKREEDRRRREEAAARRAKEKKDAEEMTRRQLTLQVEQQREAKKEREREERDTTEKTEEKQAGEAKGAAHHAGEGEGEVQQELTSSEQSVELPVEAEGEAEKEQPSEDAAVEELAVARVQKVDGGVEEVEVVLNSEQEQRKAEAEAAHSHFIPPPNTASTAKEEVKEETQAPPADSEAGSKESAQPPTPGDSQHAAAAAAPPPAEESVAVTHPHVEPAAPTTAPALLDTADVRPPAASDTAVPPLPHPVSTAPAAAVLPSSSSAAPPPATPMSAAVRADADQWWTGQLYGSPLHSVIISLLIDLSFLPSFTSSSTPTPFVVRHELHLGRCWSAGAGFPPKLSSSAYSASSTFPYDEWELDGNRVEVLRCLLTAISTSFFSPSMLVHDPFVLALTSSPHELTTTLAFSLLNVVLGYKAEAVLPYSYAISTDYRAPLVELSLHLLLLLLDFPTAADLDDTSRREGGEGGAAVPSQQIRAKTNGHPAADVALTEPIEAKAPRSSPSLAPSSTPLTLPQPTHPSTFPPPSTLTASSSPHPNQFTARLFSLSPADRSYLFQSSCRLLQYGMQSNATYLPGSSGGITIEAELFILLWKLLDRDSGFLPHVLEHCDVLHMLTPLLHYTYSARDDHTKLGLMYTCVFILLKLSGERAFSVELNRPIGSVPSLSHIPLLSILAFPDLSEGSYADALIVIAHQLIVSSPNHLEALLKVLLTLLANISPYLTRISSIAAVRLLALFELFTSPAFLYATPTNHVYAQLLLETFTTLVQYQYAGSGQLILAIVRRARAFYALRPTAPGEAYTQPMQGVGSKGHAIVFQRMATTQPQGPQQPPRIPETPTAAQGAAPGGSSAPGIAPPQPVIPASSEEGKGELPQATATPSAAFHALPSPASSAASAPPPSAGQEEGAAIREWKARLPLECVFRLFDFLLPKVERMARATPTLTDAAVLHFIQSQTLVGILPLPHPIVVRRYVPNRFTNTWFSTYTAGLCFMKAQQGPFKLFDTSKVKLFTITNAQHTAKGEQQAASTSTHTPHAGQAGRS